MAALRSFGEVKEVFMREMDVRPRSACQNRDDSTALVIEGCYDSGHVSADERNRHSWNILRRGVCTLLKNQFSGSNIVIPTARSRAVRRERRGIQVLACAGKHLDPRVARDDNPVEL